MRRDQGCALDRPRKSGSDGRFEEEDAMQAEALPLPRSCRGLGSAGPQSGDYSGVISTRSGAEDSIRTNAAWVLFMRRK
jgi:hypothetical protein